MSAPPPELLAYHVGFVVRDLDQVRERYQRLLNIDLWREREVARARPPWAERYTDTRLRIAFGRGAGMTFELIQVLEGRNQHAEFLETYGEGVQHIGLWSADVRASVEAAVANGARIVNALIDANDTAAVQLTPGSRPEEILPHIPRSTLAYVDPGVVNVQLEFVGPGTGLREWLGDDFERMFVAPPWSRPASS